eukprot:664020-Amphidinium_carterae.1
MRFANQAWGEFYHFRQRFHTTIWQQRDVNPQLADKPDCMAMRADAETMAFHSAASQDRRLGCHWSHKTHHHGV